VRAGDAASAAAAALADGSPRAGGGGGPRNLRQRQHCIECCRRYTSSGGGSLGSRCSSRREGRARPGRSRRPFSARSATTAETASGARVQEVEREGSGVGGIVVGRHVLRATHLSAGRNR